MKAYIFDIDGTIADLHHRLHFIREQGVADKNKWYEGRPPFKKDYDAFYAACMDDKPIQPVITINQMLWDVDHGDQIAEYGLLFMTGRPEKIRKETLAWMDNNYVIWHKLYMRPDGDHRPAVKIKAEMYDQAIADGYEPIMAFEDHTSCVEMWRSKGLICAQVAEGDF